MLNVLTLEEAEARLAARFGQKTPDECVRLCAARGRVLRRSVRAGEDLPPFTRASVDGYAVRARDTFGCSESLPAVLRLTGRVEMGEGAAVAVEPDCCVYVPTGGALPEGADAMVMLEFAEGFGQDMAILKPAAPGQNIVLRGDDAKAGDAVLEAGRIIEPPDIGTAAALGITELWVAGRPRAAVLSTGDELVSAHERPRDGRMRDVNGPMLMAALEACGAEARFCGIVPDDEGRLEAALRDALEDADIVLLSGSSSAGDKDAAARVLQRMGALLFHGLALKPGKPALAADVGGVPVVGLPGHPAAAYMVFHLLARPMLGRMQGRGAGETAIWRRLESNLPSNHGREELVPVRLEGEACVPLVSKSGLVTTLSKSDGYIRIPRDTEGLGRGETVRVYLWRNA